MAEKDYHTVPIGNAQVGLVGLEEIFEELKDEKGKSEAELKTALVEKVGQRNYVSPSVRQEYEKALLREFKKFLGEKVEEEQGGFLEVTLLGRAGCHLCNKLEQDVLAVLSETGIQASLNHISDPGLIVQYGILSPPAVIINGKVKSTGRVPIKSAIKKWLEEEKR